MTLSPKALQKKREKKKQNRQAKISKTAVTTSNQSNFSNWSVYECWVASEIWSMGLGYVIVSRRNNFGDVAAGIFLIDTYCLGIKDCFIRVMDIGSYKDLLQDITLNSGELDHVDSTYANTLIHKSKEFAMRIGFKPHKDFLKAQSILKNIDVDQTMEFAFGRDNEPLYVPGPHESNADINRIMKTLDVYSEQNGSYIISSLPPEELQEVAERMES